MTILIVGAGGRVGRLLERRLEPHFPDRVIAATREELDLTDSDRLAMEIERLEPRPGVVVNCAALTDPRRTEAGSWESLGAHREGVVGLARACRELGCRLIHFSTVQVFDGSKREPYVEEDFPNPATPYGRVRHLGELAAAAGTPDHLVIRLSLLCGDGDPADPLSEIRQAVDRGNSLAWDERRVSPIFAEDLASSLLPILRSDWKGVLHLANSGTCLLSDLAAEAARHLGARSVPGLIGGPGPGSFREGEGLNAALEVRLYTALSGRRPREWKSALAKALQSDEGS